MKYYSELTKQLYENEEELKKAEEQAKSLMDELLEYLRGVDFSVNVISKSGTTMETKITYELIKDLMKEKYSDSEIKERIIVTTDKSKGLLREEVNEVGYESFIIEDDIGGRYSIVTPAHLFPLAFNIDLDKFIEGIHDGKDLINEAYTYSVIRRMMFDSGKVVENYVVYEQNMYYFAEWLKQLFGETEGKNGRKITFPAELSKTKSYRKNMTENKKKRL